MVIVCKASHACHLEVTEGYDTANFLSAFDEFTHLRGKPSSVVADKGSQIVSAGTSECLWKHVFPFIIRNYSPDEIEWNFVPSGPHHFIGSVERMVQCFERTMKAVTSTKSPSFTKLQFRRLLYSVNNLISDRPLALGEHDITKLNANRLLCPNALLMGRSTSDISPLVDIDYNNYLSADERYYTNLLALKYAFINNFWSKWYEQVFNVLLPRTKWLKTGRQLQVQNIVIIRDTNPVRGK